MTPSKQMPRVVPSHESSYVILLIGLVRKAGKSGKWFFGGQALQWMVPFCVHLDPVCEASL